MPTITNQIESVLRGRPDRLARSWADLALLILAVVLFGMAYGAVMGTFGPVGLLYSPRADWLPVLGERSWQIVYSALKVPLLLLATFVLSLPSFFVFNTLLGLRNDFGAAVRALAATQAGLVIVLASFAPLTALWYFSVSDYPNAVLFNGLMFGAASLAGQWLLRKHYAPLIARNRRHRVILWTWVVLYGFVGIQMGWILRPFVGDPDSPVRFFREDTWGNAYVIVGHSIWRLITGSEF